LTADFELRRGVIVHFRLIDKVTRQPVRGVIHYTPLATNRHYREAELHVGLVPTREFDRVHVPDRDGYYDLVAYPGPGLLLFNGQGNNAKYLRSQNGKFLPSRLDPADEEKAQGDHHLGFAKLFPWYRLIEPKDGERPLVFDGELTAAPPQLE